MIAVFIIGLISILLDQLTKNIISHTFELYESRPVIKGFFDLEYVRNNGIAWSLQVKLWILILITIIAIGLFIYLSFKLKWKKDKWYIFTLGLLFGGAIGNFIDRIFQKDHSVIDFLSFTLYYPSFKDGFHFEEYFFPVFNVADISLVIGAIMFIIYILFIDKKKKEEANDSSDEVVDIKNE